MSAPAVKRTIFDEMADAELGHWPGVSWSRSIRGKHYQLTLTFAGRSRFVIYSCSPSDGRRGGENHLRDIRAALRDLGATRRAEQKSTAPARRRNRTEPRRVVITDRATGGPRRDPWAALEGFTPRIVQPEPTPPTRPSWWRRMFDLMTGKASR